MYCDVNERFGGLAETFRFIATEPSFSCECADLTCAQQMPMTRDEYDAVRAHATHFAVRPGHVLSDVEDVVSEHDAYVVVAKRNAAAEVAGAQNPRGREAG